MMLDPPGGTDLASQCQKTRKKQEKKNQEKTRKNKKKKTKKNKKKQGAKRGRGGRGASLLLQGSKDPPITSSHETGARSSYILRQDPQ